MIIILKPQQENLKNNIYSYQKFPLSLVALNHISVILILFLNNILFFRHETILYQFRLYPFHEWKLLVSATNINTTNVANITTRWFLSSNNHSHFFFVLRHIEPTIWFCLYKPSVQKWRWCNYLFDAINIFFYLLQK